MTQGLSRREMLKGGIVLASGIAISPLFLQGSQALAAGPLPWSAANTILSETTVPTFPNKTFNVTDYGAKGDSSTDNTSAFQKAIAACNAAGGGQVVVPSGTFVTGAIQLLSNVNDPRINRGGLCLDSTATRYISQDVALWLQHPTHRGISTRSPFLSSLAG